MDTASFIVSFVELIIEFIFCFIVWKEFKMTRKSFEWQIDKEYNQKLTAIVKYFLGSYTILIMNRRMMLEEAKRNFVSISNISEEEYKELYPDDEKKLKYLLDEYKVMNNRENNRETSEEEEIVINKINKIFVLGDLNISFYKIEKDEEYQKYINSYHFIDDGVAKETGIDYKIIERIYNNIYFHSLRKLRNN